MLSVCRSPFLYSRGTHSIFCCRCCISEFPLYTSKFTFTEKFFGNHQLPPRVTSYLAPFIFLLTIIRNWILHFLWPWESILYTLDILFPWVLGLYKIQLLNSSAHHLEKNPAYISPPHQLSIWLWNSVKNTSPSSVLRISWFSPLFEL